MEQRTGFLSLSGAEDGSVRFEGECEVAEDGGQTVVTFDESASGIENTRTHLIFTDDTVTLDRAGDYETYLVFSEGAESAVRLGSPFGNIDMLLKTDRLAVRRTRGEICADVRYRLFLGDSCLKNVLTARCRITDDSEGKNS